MWKAHGLHILESMSFVDISNLKAHKFTYFRVILHISEMSK